MGSAPSVPAGVSNPPDFKLGDWWVRPQRNELERGEEVAHVEARSMEVLVCLARHAPGVVGKQRLLDEVWSDSPFVGEEVISHAVWELRKVLGDSARAPAYIKTVPRKGYLLVAEIVRPRGSALPVEGARIDHYEIGDEIGRGSMGVVYRAFDRRLERTVAIKFLAPELTRDRDACRRFQREARVAASLDHPNLATVHAVGETSEGQLYLVTPYYAGGSLKQACARGTLSIEDSVRYARQLARGLAAAHSRGIVHRDVKPANLLLDEHGTLKIADFGIAKLLGATDLTHTGVSLGTPAYKSPEQAQGRPVDHRSDLWAFGVVLFEMLTGRRPFDGEYELAVVHSILSAEPSAETDREGRPIPEALRRVVARAMAKDPEARYQSGEEVVGELESLDGAGERGGPVEKRQPSPGPVFPAALRQWAAASGALLLLLLIAGYAVWRTAHRPAGGKAAADEAASVSTPPKEVRDLLDRASDLWLRGNDPRNLQAVRRQLSEVVGRAPDWPKGLGLFAAFLADSYAITENGEDREEAERLLRRSRSLDPEEPLSWDTEAQLLWVSGEYEAARGAADRAVTLQRECRRRENCDLAYLRLAEVQWTLGNRSQALETLEAGTEQGNGHIRCRLKRAQLYEQGGEPERAVLDYLYVLEKLDPTQSTALNDLGVLRLKNRDFEKAASLYQQLFERTRDPRALYNRGIALYELHRWEDAIAAYEQAQRLYRDAGIVFPAAAVALGDTYSELGETTRAGEHYRSALDAFDDLLAGPDPRLEPRGQRAVCLAKLGRIAEAEGEMASLLAHADKHPRLLLHAARIAALAGDRDALFDRARRAIDAGLSIYELTNDAAFLDFREDAEYLAHLER